MNTKEDLKTAFAGESQANQKYRAFAKKAEQEGFPNVSRLFRTTAEAERIHAEGHLRALEGVGSTRENLEAAIAGESYEVREMYPPMLARAEAEKHVGRMMIGFALKTEAQHAKLYQLALEAVMSGKDLTEAKFYLCPFCGQIEFGTPPEKCPVCGAKREKFVQTEL